MLYKHFICFFNFFCQLSGVSQLKCLKCDFNPSLRLPGERFFQETQRLISYSGSSAHWEPLTRTCGRGWPPCLIISRPSQSGLDRTWLKWCPPWMRMGETYWGWGNVCVCVWIINEYERLRMVCNVAHLSASLLLWSISVRRCETHTRYEVLAASVAHIAIIRWQVEMVFLAAEFLSVFSSTTRSRWVFQT